jgi:hypothetical protein
VRELEPRRRRGKARGRGREKVGAAAGGGRGRSPDSVAVAVHELHAVTSQLPPSLNFVGSEPEGRVTALLHRGQVREAAGSHERWKATAGSPACSSLLCCPGQRRGARADEDAAAVVFFCGWGGGSGGDCEQDWRKE